MGKNSILSENQEESPSTSVVGEPFDFAQDKRSRWVQCAASRSGKRSRWAQGKLRRRDQDKQKKQ